jgi:predicted esterase
MVPFTPEKLPDLTGTSVLVTAGRHDPIVPPAHADELARMLTEAGASVALEWQPGGHELTPEEAQTVRAWLEDNATESKPS